MYREILSQSKVLKNTYETNQELAQRLAKNIKDKKIKQIFVVARGSSNNACMYFKYLCEILVGIPVNFVNPSVITAYKGKLDMSNSVVIGVSQSGKALDVQLVLFEASKQGATCVAVTNSLTSSLSLTTQYHFYLDVEEEISVAATKTFTAQMLVLQMIVFALADEKTHLPSKLPILPSLLDSTFELAPQLDILADKLLVAKELFVLSRGLALAVGDEIALKLQETCYLNARSYAISNFHHGPFALVNADSNILLIALNGQTYLDNQEIFNKLSSVGCNIYTISQSQELVSSSAFGVLLPECDQFYAPFSAVVAGQLLANSLSLKRSLNPDSPRGLSKVTITK